MATSLEELEISCISLLAPTHPYMQHALLSTTVKTIIFIQNVLFVFILIQLTNDMNTMKLDKNYTNSNSV